MDRIISITEIKSKNRKSHGVTYAGRVLKGHIAEICPEKYIRIHGSEDNHVNGTQYFDKTFCIGDWAEYDSYNLKYTGVIKAIGIKSITIQSYPNTHNAENHRLSIYDFSWRNWDFDTEKIAKHNNEERMYI